MSIFRTYTPSKSLFGFKRTGTIALPAQNRQGTYPQSEPEQLHPAQSGIRRLENKSSTGQSVEEHQFDTRNGAQW